MIIRAWHFVGHTLRDGRLVPPDGEWLVHTGPVRMCKSGLHASRDPFDALQHAPGPVLCMVDCADVEQEVEDNLVCRSRRIVRRIDATSLLRLFARQCALDVIHLWDAPRGVRDYLTTGDESIRAAAYASVSYTSFAACAANAANYANAAYAANAAAYAAAYAAAVANAAAAYATPATARKATRAARAAQRARFNQLVQEAFA